MPALLNAPVKHAAAKATLELPFFIPAKEWFGPKELAAIAGMSERYVEKKFEQGTELSGHTHNAGRGMRETIRIPRVWAVTWLVRTARYDDASLADAVIACLHFLPVASLLKIADAARALVARKHP